MGRTPPERLVVGRIVRPHGLHGEVLVIVESDAPERFRPGSRLGLEGPGGGIEPVTVAATRLDRGRLLVRFEELGDRTAADRARGAVLSIPAAEARAPEEGAYYPHQIEGLEVVDESGERLGTLARVEWGPANDVWVVATGDREVLVPAVSEVVRAVEPGRGRIVLRPLGGMFDAPAPRPRQRRRRP